MAEHLPLLVFPQKRVVAPDPARGFPGGNPHHPGKGRQVERLTPELEALQQSLERYRASLTGALGGLEPELVLVLEIAGSLESFQQAVEKPDWSGWAKSHSMRSSRMATSMNPTKMASLPRSR